MVLLAACAISGLLISGTLLPSFGFFADGYYFWNPLHALSAKALLAIVVVHVVLRLPAMTRPFRRTDKAGDQNPVRPKTSQHRTEPPPFTGGRFGPASCTRVSVAAACATARRAMASQAGRTDRPCPHDPSCSAKAIGSSPAGRRDPRPRPRSPPGRPCGNGTAARSTPDKSPCRGRFTTICQRYAPRSFASAHGLAGSASHASPPKSRTRAESAWCPLRPPRGARRPRPCPTRARWPCARRADTPSILRLGKLVAQEERAVVGSRRADGHGVGLVGLHEHAAGQIGAARPTGHLLDKRERALPAR